MPIDGQDAAVKTADILNDRNLEMQAGAFDVTDRLAELQDDGLFALIDGEDGLA